MTTVYCLQLTALQERLLTHNLQLIFKVNVHIVINVQVF